MRYLPTASMTTTLVFSEFVCPDRLSGTSICDLYHTGKLHDTPWREAHLLTGGSAGSAACLAGSTSNTFLPEWDSSASTEESLHQAHS